MLVARVFPRPLFDGSQRFGRAIALTQRITPARDRDGVEGGGRERSIGIGPTE
jgi:hypothetical protein